MCTNTEGSFVCSCEEGFLLDEDGKTCSGEEDTMGGSPGQRESRYHERCLFKNAHPYPPSLSGPVWCSNGNGWYEPKFKNNHWFERT